MLNPWYVLGNVLETRELLLVVRKEECWAEEGFYTFPRARRMLWIFILSKDKRCDDFVVEAAGVYISLRRHLKEPCLERKLTSDRRATTAMFHLVTPFEIAGLVPLALSTGLEGSGLRRSFNVCPSLCGHQDMNSATLHFGFFLRSFGDAILASHQ